ncbi:MarR family transcriptional regulator [Candidatus Bathyarchaeota archaeon]|nr:MarR family transcriptional regulator [Candidatus Bathyarchaeota archaeon]
MSSNPLFFPKWQQMLAMLLKNQEMKVVDFHKQTNLTYSHANKLVRLMTEQGFLRTQKVGRCRFVSMTEKGRQVAILVNHLAKK